MNTFCSHCGLAGGKLVKGENLKPPTGKRVIFIGEAPGAEEVKQGRPFVGESGKILRQTIDALGFDIGEALITNVCLCRPPGNRDPSSTEIMCCRDRLIEEIHSYQPDVIVLLGAIALSALFPGKTITKSRGFPIQFEGIWCIPTWHPAKLLHISEDFRDFVHDIHIAYTARFPFSPLKNTYTVVDNEEALQVLYTNMQLHSGLAAIDIETTGLRLFQSKVLAVGVTLNGNHSYIIPEATFKSYRPLMKKVFENKTIQWVGHTAVAFDRQFLLRHYGISIKIEFDIMLMHYTIDERKGTHKLKQLAVRYLQTPDYSEEIEGHFVDGKVAFADVPIDVLYRYLSNDCCATYKLSEILIEEYNESLYYNTLLPQAEVVAEMQTRGIKVDVGYMKRTGEQLELDADKVLSQIRILVGIVDFNPRSPKQVSDLLYRRLRCVSRSDSTDRKTLDNILRDIENKIGQVADDVFTVASDDPTGLIMRYVIVKGILDYRQLTHMKSQYIDGILELVDGDFRVRTSYLIHGTETGRLSSNSPNLMNIPHYPRHDRVQGKLIRDGFIPADEYTFVECDYKALELRILAYYSKDERLVSDILTEDLHTATAARMFNVKPKDVTPNQRVAAKSINFGVMYLRGADSISKAYRIPYDDCKRFIASWYAVYSVAAAWMKEVEVFVVGTDTINGHYYIETPIGRRRRFPLVTNHNKNEVIRQAINHPIQSLASDCCLNGLTRINALFDPQEIRPIITVHDSILFEVDSSNLKPLVDAIEDTLNEPFIESPIDFPVDVTIGSRWGSLVEKEKYFESNS